MLREWLLSRQCQLTAQAVVGILGTSVFTVAQPLHFRSACLAPVFVVIIIAALAQDQHVGTRIQVTALLLGPAWLAVLLAIATMSLAKLAETPEDPWNAGYVTAATLLALAGLAVLILVRAAAPPGPARVMGILAAVIYGIIVLLSVPVITVQGFLLNAVGYVVLSMVVAAAVCLAVGLCVAPSLATDEVIRLTAETLQGAGTILSYHTSVLMADHHGPTTSTNNSTSNTDAAAGTAAVAAAGGAAMNGPDVAIRVHASHAAPAAYHGRTGSAEGAHLAAAAAAAAVVAAREHEHATLDWVDEQEQQQAAAGAAGTIAATIGSAGPKSSVKSIAGSSVGSSSSTGTRSSSLSSLHGLAAAVEGGAAANRQAAGTRQQQQGDGQRLSESLLAGLQAAGDDEQHQGGVSREQFTAAWVAAAASVAPDSRQASVNLDALEGCSTDGAASPFVAAQLIAGSARPHARQSLEGAASLVFVAEMDDQAFLASMRTLSRSRPYGSSPSLQKLSSQQQQQQKQQQGQQQQLGRQQGSYPKSAPSVVSSTGSLLADAAAEPKLETAAADKAGYSRAATTGSLGRQGSMRAAWADADTSFCGKHDSLGRSGDRQHSRLRLASSSSLLRVLAARSFGSIWGGTGSASQQQQQQQQRMRHKSSISWADLAGKPASSAASDAADSGNHTPARALQQQQQPAVWEQAAPVTAAQLGLLIGRAKAILPAARLEPQWLRPKGFVEFDADAWASLLEDAELLLVRVSTLEALSDERRLQGLQLHHLKHYRNIADAMAMTLAQLAAFLAHVAKAVERQQASRHAPSWCGWLLRKKGSAAVPAKRLHKPPPQQQLKQLQQPHPFSKVHQPAGQPAAGRASPFAATSATAATAAAAAKAEEEAASIQDGVSWSAVLSGLERQGSGVSSYLWERKGGWETGRQLLLREIESSVGSYWWAVRRATKQAPVQVPRSREVMTLTFIWPITNGLLDALERIEASAQRVLSTQHRQHQQLHQHQQQQQAGQSRARGWLSSIRREQQQWLQPLLALLAIQPGLQAVKQALFKDLPLALSSKQGFASMLASRSFQAGAKLLLATGSALVLTMLLMVYDVRVRSLAPIFGFTSVCLSMQERVEATTDKVVGRILGTIVGACLGLAITLIPGVFSAPVLLLACIAAASVPLSMLAKAEARTGVALALLTLLAVALCSYELACCVPGAHLMSPMTVFLARMGSVVGACIYVALLNRLLLPWYTSDYALEQMADALEQAAALFEKIYTSQHNRMRVAALAAGGSVAADADALSRAEAGGCGTAAGAGHTGVLDSAAAAAELAALEAGEAALHVALRQEVLRRLVAVQMSLAKDTVSWRRGVLATPQIVLDVLGAMIELVEALACQRLALAPFTRQGVNATSGPGAAAIAGESAAPSGLLRVSGHCYSVWAQPLHPVWLQVLAAVQDLAATTAQQLRRMHTTSASGGCSSSSRSSSSGREELLAKLSKLEACRLQLRRGWLDIRTNLHKHVHAGSVAAAALAGAAQHTADAPVGSELSALPASARFWPIDSVHFFTFTYGASRVLNKLAGVTQALLAASR